MGPNATDRLKRPIDGNQNRHRTAAPITNTARGDMKQTIPFPGRVQQFPIRPLHTLHKPILPAQTRYPPKSTPFIQRPPRVLRGVLAAAIWSVIRRANDHIRM